MGVSAVGTFTSLPKPNLATIIDVRYHNISDAQSTPGAGMNVMQQDDFSKIYIDIS